MHKDESFRIFILASFTRSSIGLKVWSSDTYKAADRDCHIDE